MFFHNFNLTLFRSYETLRLDFQGAKHVVLTGPNGAGKTNILEALSFLAPGRGLRGAGLLDVKHTNAEEQDIWAVFAEGMHNDDKVRLGTALDRGQKKRVVRIDGKDASAQSTLAELLSVVWLTPQMDGLFIEGATGRRKFLDRLVYTFDPAHAGRLARFEKNLRQRMRVLQGELAKDARWLTVLEQSLAADTVAIAAARKNTVAWLSKGVLNLRAAASLFPTPALQISGFAEEELECQTALAVEEALCKKFQSTRIQDGAVGRTQEGAQRSDLIVSYAVKNTSAAQCSTGEQKGMMIAIMLAHAQMAQAEKGHAPVLLLDEVAAHLDIHRRAQLFEILGAMKGQVFLTGTDAGVFDTLNNKLHLHVQPGRVLQNAPDINTAVG